MRAPGLRSLAGVPSIVLSIVPSMIPSMVPSIVPQRRPGAPESRPVDRAPAGTGARAATVLPASPLEGAFSCTPGG